MKTNRRPWVGGCQLTGANLDGRFVRCVSIPDMRLDNLTGGFRSEADISSKCPKVCNRLKPVLDVMVNSTGHALDSSGPNILHHAASDVWRIFGGVKGQFAFTRGHGDLPPIAAPI